MAASRDSLVWVLKVWEAVLFMLGSKLLADGWQSSTADEVLGRSASDDLRCIGACRKRERMDGGAPLSGVVGARARLFVVVLFWIRA